MNILLRSALYLIVLPTWCGAVEACPMAIAENFNYLVEADVVVRGNLLSEPLFVTREGEFARQYYRANILVTETMAGRPKLNGRRVSFVFYRPVNRNVEGLSVGLEIIVGLRKPKSTELSTGPFFIESSWFSVASSCDSVGVIMSKGSRLGDIRRGIEGKFGRTD